MGARSNRSKERGQRVLFSDLVLVAKGEAVSDTPKSFDEWWNTDPKDEAGKEYGLDEFHLLREGWRECITHRVRPLERELSSANEQIAKLREALAVHLSHYDAEGNRICTEEFMREVVKESRAALAATRNEEGNDACVHGVSLRGHCNVCDASEVG